MISATTPSSRREMVNAARSNTDSTEAITIASISDQDWYISRTYGVYHIPACEKGQHSTTLLITQRSDALDFGDSRRMPITISPRQIAEDLLQDLQDHGVFLCASERPSEAEIASAIDRRDRYYHKLVAEADTMWARGHSFREISDLQRRAAIALGIERDWAYVPTRMVDCPACGEKVKPGIAVCRHCRAILDPEKAAKHGLGPKAGAEPATPGASGNHSIERGANVMSSHKNDAMIRSDERVSVTNRR